MAELWRTDGTVEKLAWDLDGHNSDVMRRVFGDRIFCLWRTKDGRVSYADDNGLIDDLPVNVAASALYAGPTGIRGDVIVLDHDETRAEMEAI